MMALKYKKLVGDFETTTDPNDLRVWASCLVDIETNKVVHLENNIEALYKYLETKNCVVYYHNLKFDIEWHLAYLLRNGYTHSRKPKEKTFNTLITDQGVVYFLTVYFKQKNKAWKKVVFYDSLKKLPFSAAKIAKTFELPDQKLKIDYHEYRAPGHRLTEHERHYIENDCKIIAQALKIQFSKGLKRMTAAADAMADFKERLGRKTFYDHFPVFPIELDDQLRNAYKGGFTYLDPRHKNEIGLQGIVFDVNSLYPSVMIDKPMPYGFPVFGYGEPEPDPDFPLYIVVFECQFELKPDHIPTIQIKGGQYHETEYLTTSATKNNPDEMVVLTMTSVDYELMKDHYEIKNPIFIKHWKFRAVTGIFNAYMDHWGNEKINAKDAPSRQIAKNMMNNLYGKFASNPHSKKKIPYLDKSGVVKYEFEDEEDRDPVYTAVGAFITAYAREKTIRAAQSVYDRFIYADTDSLHLVGTELPDGLDIDPKRLGAWKHEGTFYMSKYIRAKTYMETMHGTAANTLKNLALCLSNADWARVDPDDGLIHYITTKVTCAGMPDNVKESVDYDNFHEGSVFEGKLMPKRYPGGIVLEERSFTIK